MLGKSESFPPPKTPPRKWIRFGTGEYPIPPGLETRRCLAQKLLRLHHMFDDRPKCDGVKTPIAKVKVQKRLANDLEAPTLRVIQRSASHVRASHGVIPWKLRLELVQKRAGGATHVQYGAGLAMRAEQSQLPLEAHRRVIALPFVRRQIKRSAEPVVKPPGRQLRFDRVGVNHRTIIAANQTQRAFAEQRLRILSFAQGTEPMDAV